VSAQFWRARANGSPEVAHLSCRFPLPALRSAPGCAPASPAAVSTTAKACFTRLPRCLFPARSAARRGGKLPPPARSQRRMVARAPARRDAPARRTFVVSPHLLRERTNPTRCTVPETTTSKICAGDASTRGCPRASPPSPRPPTAQHVSPRALPSIFARRGFGRYVATRFLAAADLHGHRPAVPTRARASCPRPAA